MIKTIVIVSAAVLATGCANNMTPERRAAMVEALMNISNQQYEQAHRYQDQAFQLQQNMNQPKPVIIQQVPAQPQWVCPSGKKSGPACQ